MSLQDDMMAEAVNPVHAAVRGVAVTYHPAGAADEALEGCIFKEDKSSDVVAADPGGSSTKRTGTLRIEKTTRANADADDQVTIRGNKWDIVTVDDLVGAWRLNIRRTAAVERGAARFRMAGM